MNISGSGRVMLSGSADAPLQNLKIFGKSVQNGTPSPENPVPIVSLGRPVPGKNLCPYGTKTFTSTYVPEPDIDTSFGYFLSPGTYTFSATVTSTDEKHDVCQVILANTTKAEDSRIIETGFIGRNNRSSVTFTISEPFNAVYLYAGYDYLNSEGETATFSDIQLELGSSATTYEPYRVVDQKMAITVSGKNLLDIRPEKRTVITDDDAPDFVVTKGPFPLDKTYMYIGISMNGYWEYKNITSYNISDEEISLETMGSGYGIGFNVPIKPNTAYYFSLLEADKNNRIGYVYLDKDGYILSYEDNIDPNKTFTTPADAAWIVIVFRPTQNVLTTFKNPQLELGSSATQYMPYKDPQVLEFSIPCYEEDIEPYGLPGVPVSSGGNYTDENGQQWICDEIDFKKGVYIQRCAYKRYGTEIPFNKNAGQVEGGWNVTGNTLPFFTTYYNGRDDSLPVADTSNAAAGFSDKFQIRNDLVGGDTVSLNLCSQNYLAGRLLKTYFEPYGFDDSNYIGTSYNAVNAYFSEDENGFYVLYPLQVPLKYSLPESLIEAWNPISKYYPDTTIENDAGAFMWAQYLTNDDLPADGPYTYPKTEVGQYYKALARYTLSYPEATCRECQLIRHLLDDTYELPFEVNDDSSRTEKYLWDLISNTKTMLSNIPKSDTEKFLHMMLGGEVIEYPTIDCERNFWMARCVEQALLTMALMNGGRA